MAAAELETRYHERWAIEQIFHAFQTHPRGPRVVLRSKTPEGVQQEAWGYLLTHYALRKLLYDAAVQVTADPDRRARTRASAFSP